MANSVFPRYVSLELNIPYDWDDYDVWCSFYFDLVERKVIRTDRGHGSRGNEVDCNDTIRWRDALEQRLVTAKELARAIMSYLGNMDNMVCLMVGKYGVPCSVESGRKMRGENLILVEVVRELAYVQPRYQSSYYGYQPNYDYYAIVYDPAKNVKCKLNADYVTVKGEDKAEIVVKAVVDNTERYMRDLIHCLAYKASLSACDTANMGVVIRNLYNAGLLLNAVSIPDMNNVIDPWERKRINAKQEKHRSRVEAWAREKLAGESEEKIQQVIERTLQKYYA